MHGFGGSHERAVLGQSIASRRRLLIRIFDENKSSDGKKEYEKRNTWETEVIDGVDTRIKQSMNNDACGQALRRSTSSWKEGRSDVDEDADSMWWGKQTGGRPSAVRTGVVTDAQTRLPRSRPGAQVAQAAVQAWPTDRRRARQTDGRRGARQAELAGTCAGALDAGETKQNDLDNVNSRLVRRADGLGQKDGRLARINGQCEVADSTRWSADWQTEQAVSARCAAGWRDTFRTSRPGFAPRCARTAVRREDYWAGRSVLGCRPDRLNRACGVQADGRADRRLGRLGHPRGKAARVGDWRARGRPARQAGSFQAVARQQLGQTATASNYQRQLWAVVGSCA
ncbi:hypothetical protein Salat_2152100 [Sesamum alatum]|uniref:Uncharacterized protein n=1 Tax=Sesamum alatum TaxID=300844 RepID=A0AAE2CHA9_9LAMI|nr:hypothetical protein Salat_2152100 [Sesamum alatum]